MHGCSSSALRQTNNTKAPPPHDPLRVVQCSKLSPLAELLAAAVPMPTAQRARRAHTPPARSTTIGLSPSCLPLGDPNASTV